MSLGVAYGLDLAQQQSVLDASKTQLELMQNQSLAVGIRGQQMQTSVFLIKALGGGWQGIGVQAGP